MLYRIHNRLVFSGRCITPDTSVGSLSRRERAGVRGKDVGLLQAFTEDRVDAVEQICLRDQRSAVSLKSPSP